MSTYDPTKSYTWEPNSLFTITGKDLNLFVHLLRGMLSTPEASNIILAYEANKTVESLLDMYIKTGVIQQTGPNNVQVNEPEEIKVKNEKAKS